MGLLDYLYGRRETGQPLLDQSGVDSVGNPLFVDPATSAEGKRQALEAADAALQPGSLRRAWEASETRKALNEGIPYYLGPHAAQVLDKAGALAQMATPQFGTHDAAEAGHALDAGNYGKAAGAMALGTAGAALDMIPGEALVKGVLKGATKLPALLDVAKDAAPLSIFAGIGAKTADRTALAKAEELAAAGAPRTDIWQQTGWFQGADGKWRFEISDHASQLNPKIYKDALPEDGEGGRLDSHLSHPDLFAAYPDLRRAEAHIAQGIPQGRYFPGDEELVQVSAKNPAQARSVALHEVQHAIQDREGFAKGAPAADKDYPRSAGEEEARAVQRRLFMEPEDRNAVPPWESYAVPPEQQTVNMSYRGPTDIPESGPQMSMPLLDAEPTQPLLRAPIRAYHGSPHDFDRKARKKSED